MLFVAGVGWDLGDGRQSIYQESDSGIGWRVWVALIVISIVLVSSR